LSDKIKVMNRNMETAMKKVTVKKLPKYLCMANEYRQQIEKGIYKTGDALPDQRSLSKEWGFDPLTVRRAFDVLQREGLIHKIIGSGMYVGGKSIVPACQNMGHVNSYPFIGIVAPEVPEHHVFKILEHAAVNNVFQYKYEALRINYITQADLKSRLMQYHHFLKGIIFLRHDYSDIASNVQYAISCGIPVVVAGLEIQSQKNDIPCDCLFIDEENGGRKIVEYFIGNGHRQIALAGNHLLEIKKLGRYVGFMNTMREYGLEPVIADEKSLKLSDFGNDSASFQQACGVKIASRIMNKRKRPTAIMCKNDNIALGILEQLKKMNIACPEEVEVFGFGDDIRWPEMYFPAGVNPLSSAGVNYNELGRHAVDMLITRIAHPAMERKTESLKSVIIHRQTTREINNGIKSMDSKLKQMSLSFTK
jgi:GntR family transcriptional regulator of arabinose operon